ncbi:hypothetical protein B0H21DRAFT_851701, partial [Amylocystis lapponica]
MQVNLAALTKIHTRLHRSPVGNVFYQNSVPDLLALDWANPETRPYIEEYPIRSQTVSESYHSRKWTHEIDAELQAPMWAAHHSQKHYFLGEMAGLSDGRRVVPLAWFRYCSHGEVYGEGYELSYETTVRTHSAHSTSNRIEFQTTSLEFNHFDLVDDGERPAYNVYHGPNPLRDIAKGRRMYTSFIKPWGDDVSGNRSKQYNAHTNIYFSHANLPHDKQSQEYFVRFCSTSPNTTAGEQFDVLIKETTGPNTWHTAYDCHAQDEILFRVIPLNFPADNPQQSESCSHVGLHGNFWCRRCKLGGTERDRETDDLYHQHFSGGPPRTATETVTEVTRQIETAALGVAKSVASLQTLSGVKDKLAEHWIQELISRAREMQRVRITSVETRDPRLKALKNEAREQTHPSLISSVLICVVKGGDIHADSPVEILHTILLGLIKYVWFHTNSPWKDKQCETFAVRLQSSSIDGLSIPPLRASYMLQYRNNLIGKHFKAIQQLAIFHLDDGICPRLVRDLWKANGELGALLWYHEIEDMDTYLADLDILIGNVLDIWSLIDPRKIFVKPKLHILPHILQDIPRHGPPILYATEIFECYNAVFRMCSVLSNHQAPSRDIAWTFADLERFKHEVSGGWWRGQDDQFVRAGPRVREYFSNLQVQRRLGYIMYRLTNLDPGTVHMRKKGRVSVVWSSLQLHTSPMCPSIPDLSEWYQCEYIVSQAHDRCKLKSWVFVRHATRVGRIHTILSPVGGTDRNDIQPCVIIEPFDLTNSRHPHFGMPELINAAAPRVAHLVILATDILFIVNVQHNCIDGRCSASGRRMRKQERLETEISQPFIEHTNDTHYVLNTHALHNAALIRKTLPRHLTEPHHYL